MTMLPSILLASGSPRRRELLALTGLPFTPAAVDIDETPLPGEPARAYTVRLSQEKARVALPLAAGHDLVLAADTTVADGEAILGKPADPAEAWAMLRRLRGRTHQVYTALTLIHTVTGQQVTEVAVTEVPMRPYSDAEIAAYIASGDPFDKAGGYAIQHQGFRPAVLTSGCFANVVGLPLCHLLRALRRLTLDSPANVPAACQSFFTYDCDVTESILADSI
ncbi:MAG: nucleoside triphosphate pyrophosphatase [Anaerolineae bacterium]